MLELREKLVDFIYNIFANDCKNDNVLKFESEYFNNVVQECFNELIKDKKPENKPFLIRVAGQCGSGKTTQLLPSIKNNIKNDNYIHLAVRLFAKKHPYYDKLLNEFGEGLIREKTNGFALLCLFKLSEMLIKNKYNVFLEMTILDPAYENYINRLAKNFNYSVLFNVMSIPKEISNYLANQRTMISGLEKNRIMPQKTLDYFYNILSLGIESIVDNANIFDKNDYFIIWNMINNEPVLITNDFNQEIIDIFNKNRNRNDFDISKIPEFEMKFEEKCNFYREFLDKWIL